MNTVISVYPILRSKSTIFYTYCEWNKRFWPVDVPFRGLEKWALRAFPLESFEFQYYLFKYSKMFVHPAVFMNLFRYGIIKSS